MAGTASAPNPAGLSWHEGKGRWWAPGHPILFLAPISPSDTRAPDKSTVPPAPSRDVRPECHCGQSSTWLGGAGGRRSPWSPSCITTVSQSPASWAGRAGLPCCPVSPSGQSPCKVCHPFKGMPAVPSFTSDGVWAARSPPRPSRWRHGEHGHHRARR